jgi:hypothetical protein
VPHSENESEKDCELCLEGLLHSMNDGDSILLSALSVLVELVSACDQTFGQKVSMVSIDSDSERESIVFMCPFVLIELVSACDQTFGQKVSMVSIDSDSERESVVSVCPFVLI